MMESLKEDSLMEDEMHSFRGVGNRNHRQGTFSASVILFRTRFIFRITKGNRKCTIKPSLYLPVFVVYDGIDDRIVDS